MSVSGQCVRPFSASCSNRVRWCAFFWHIVSKYLFLKFHSIQPILPVHLQHQISDTSSLIRRVCFTSNCSNEYLVLIFRRMLFEVKVGTSCFISRIHLQSNVSSHSHKYIIPFRLIDLIVSDYLLRSTLAFCIFVFAVYILFPMFWVSRGFNYVLWRVNSTYCCHLKIAIENYFFLRRFQFQYSISWALTSSKIQQFFIYCN